MMESNTVDSRQGTISGIDVRYFGTAPVSIRCFAFLKYGATPAEEIQVATDEFRFQTVLELACYKGASAEVSYMTMAGTNEIRGVRLLDR
jgi:hypothetical protein